IFPCVGGRPNEACAGSAPMRCVSPRSKGVTIEIVGARDAVSSFARAGTSHSAARSRPESRAMSRAPIGGAGVQATPPTGMRSSNDQRIEEGYEKDEPPLDRLGRKEYSFRVSQRALRTVA